MPLPLEWREASAKNAPYDLPTMRQFVAPYVAALRAHAGTSSCVLAGFSFGGLVAFAAAQEIKKRGGKVEMVILLDAAANGPLGSFPRRAIRDRLQYYWNERRLHSTGRTLSVVFLLRNSGSMICEIIARGLRRGWRAGLKKVKGLSTRIASRKSAKLIARIGLTAKVDETGTPIPWSLLERVYANAAMSYSLRRLDCYGVLFRTGKGAVSSLGWEGLFAKGLEIIKVKAEDHLAIVRREKHMEVLALEISKLLFRLASPDCREIASILKRNEPQRDHPTPGVPNDWPSARSA